VLVKFEKYIHHYKEKRLHGATGYFTPTKKIEEREKRSSKKRTRNWKRP